MMRIISTHFDCCLVLCSVMASRYFSAEKKEDDYDFPLLRNGDSSYSVDLRSSGLVGQLIEGLGVEHLEFSRSICRQLLALGYGRRELHPQGVLLYDENLIDTREILGKCESPVDSHSDKTIIALELKALVDTFDAGPLSLLQLSRIAVRRTICGVHFAHHMKALSQLFPPLLYDYVADPTELLYSDYETPTKCSKLSL